MPNFGRLSGCNASKFVSELVRVRWSGILSAWKSEILARSVPIWGSPTIFVVASDADDARSTSQATSRRSMNARTTAMSFAMQRIVVLRFARFGIEFAFPRPISVAHRKYFLATSDDFGLDFKSVEVARVNRKCAHNSTRFQFCARSSNPYFIETSARSRV
jgi:hypothetical protein